MLQIFRKGRQVSSNGKAIDFTDADLEAAAKAYDPLKHEAPIVVGHPETDAPAYGWVKALKYADGHLEAEPHQVDPNFAELVDQGKFKKISASFWPPGHERNPVPAAYYLRHIGFLGAMPPAVKGLRSPQFAADDQGALQFDDWGHSTSATMWRRLREWLIEKFDAETADKVAPDYLIDSIRDAARQNATGISPLYSDPSPTRGEPTMTPEQIKQLEADKARLETELKAANEAKAKRDLEFAEAETKRKSEEATRAAEALAKRRAEMVEFTDGLVKSGQLLPVHKPGVIAILATIGAAPAIEFEEAGVKKSQPQLDFLKTFLTGLPKVVEYSELARGKVTNPNDSRAIAAEALKYQEEQEKLGNQVTIAECVQHVSGLIAA